MAVGRLSFEKKSRIKEFSNNFQGLEVIEKWKDHDLVKIIFAPHAVYTGNVT